MSSSTGALKHKNTLYDAQLREFKHAIRIEPEKLLYHVSKDRDHTPKPLTDLTLKDVAPLLRREVAIYDFVFGGSPDREELFQAIWEAWFPHRDRAISLEDPPVEEPTMSQMKTLMQAGFVATFNPLESEDSPEWKKEVITSFKPGSNDSHEEVSLSPRALQWMVDWHEAMTATVASLAQSKETEHQDLEPSFGKIFILLDRSDWKADGLLACCQEDTVSNFQLPDAGKGEVILGKQAWSTWRVGATEMVEKIMGEAVRHRT